MVSVNGAKWLKLTGNTFPNRELVRTVTTDFDPDRRCWWVKLEGHPLMTVKGKKILGQKLEQLATLGVVIERRESRG